MDYDKLIQIIYQDDSEILASLGPLSPEQLTELMIAIEILKRVAEQKQEEQAALPAAVASGGSMSEQYSGLHSVLGDNCNIEAVCPHYDPENQHAFTWRRDERGVAIVSGYDPENDLLTDWLCWCGHYETGGGRCTNCGNDAPWGADGYEDDADEAGYCDDLDFGDWTEGVPD